jgi:hypothetical protein
MPNAAKLKEEEAELFPFLRNSGYDQELSAGNILLAKMAAGAHSPGSRFLPSGLYRA